MDQTFIGQSVGYSGNGATDLTLPYAMDYGRIIAIGMIWNIFAVGSMSLVRTDGKPGVAMLGMLAGLVVNMIGDPIAIFWLDMGVEGAAWATILGQMANAVINIAALCRCRSVTLNRRISTGCGRYVLTVARGGLSSFATQFTLVLVMAVQNNQYVYYGAQSGYGPEIPMTAMGVTVKVFVVVHRAVMGIANGGQPIFGYNYGSGQYTFGSRQQGLPYAFLRPVNMWCRRFQRYPHPARYRALLAP